MWRAVGFRCPEIHHKGLNVGATAAELATTDASVHEFVMKIAARCNLNCTYCYEYSHGDETWRLAAKFMSPEVYTLATARIIEHATTHRLTDVFLGLHGGEPLLIGANRLEAMLSSLVEQFSKTDVRAHFSIQTNATLISEDIAKILSTYDVQVGISLDGDRPTNDKFRVDHRGKGSFDRVMRGIEILREHAPQQLNGILSVIDVDSDPLETFDTIAATGVENCDFLLPHYNWDRPFPGVDQTKAIYGEWLSAIWGSWLGGRHSHMRIRFLDNIVARLIGHPGIYEQMTENAAQLIVINTNGFIEGVDTLKSTASGAQITDIHLSDNSIDEVLAHPVMTMRSDWNRSLPTGCQECQIKNICTGGYLPHRYSTAREFDNPSIFCRDLKHIVHRIDTDLKETLQRKSA